LRAVLNAGYRRGHSIKRGVGKQRRKFQTFAPAALASIGVLTLPLMSRSLVIRMRRHDGSRELKRFDLDNTQDLDIVYQHVRAWARDVKLNPDPELPAELRNRDADNWRVLIAIADAVSPAWGALAREAAVAFAKDRRDEDAVVALLYDCRDVFDARGVDRIGSRALVDALNAIEDAGWSEWQGLKGDRQPRPLTPGELARLLRPLGIKPHSVWPLGSRESRGAGGKGYYRADFELAWRAYCEGDTAAQTAPLRHIGRSA
jgi:hypothetical protein